MHTLYKSLLILGVLLVGFSFNANTTKAAELVDTIVVGSSSSADYATIQEAVDATGDTGYIDIEDGTYEEDVIIPSGKDLTITGSSLDNMAVTIKGTIWIKKNSDLELTYVNMNAGSHFYGIRVGVNSTLDLKYGILRRGKNSIYSPNRGTVNLYDQVIRKAQHHGILAKKKSYVNVDTSYIKLSGKSGIRARNTRDVDVNESFMTNNATGISFKNALDKDNQVTETVFRGNDIGMRIMNSFVYKADNTFVNNLINIANL